MAREAEISRKTRETDIHLVLNLDGKGTAEVDTGIPFLDHMFTLMASHGFMDLKLRASGDNDVDDHHTVEDIGICMGKAVKEALGEKRGIVRYGEATIPMDETLVRVSMDLSNRPCLSYGVTLQNRFSGTFDAGLLKEFFSALVIRGGMTLHVDLLKGEEPHHVSEAIFKAFARAFDRATAEDPRLDANIPSTKGVL